MAAQLFADGADGSADAWREALVDEVPVEGLVNDATAQTLTLVTFGGFVSAARQVADDVVSPLADRDSVRRFTSCGDDDGLRRCVRAFVLESAERAYRRPLSSVDRDSLASMLDDIDARLASENALTIARVQLRAGIVAILTSPDFLLVVERGVPGMAQAHAPLTQHEIATRLSLLASPRLPDAQLLQAANDGSLDEAAERLRHLDRMMSLDHVREHLVDLVLHWMEIELNDSSVQDPEAAHAELSAFLHEWIAEDRPFSDFYTSRRQLQTPGGELVERNVGVLGDPALVASHTYAGTPAPISRGNFVLTRLLCQTLPSPPANIPDAPPLDDGLSQRDWLDEHRQDECVGCHNLIDNYGFPFEGLDISGRYAPGPAIDASAELPAVGDVYGPVQDLEQFASLLAESDLAQRCMTELWFRHTYGRDVVPEDASRIESLRRAWSQQGGHVAALLRAIVTSEEFVTVYGRD